MNECVSVGWLDGERGATYYKKTTRTARKGLLVGNGTRDHTHMAANSLYAGARNPFGTADLDFGKNASRQNCEMGGSGSSFVA
jgi:hypothetical protein